MTVNPVTAMSTRRHTRDDETEERVLLIRSTARSFCDDHVRPGAAERDRLERFPEELIEPMADLGFFGLLLPEEYGGVEADPWSYAALMEELGAADSSVRSIVSVSGGLVGESIVKWGTEEQKSSILPRIVAGELGAFGLTEAGSGSNPAELKTKAVADGEGWRINGSKMFITNGSRGSLTMIFARAERDGSDLGVTCFLVPQDGDGYVATPIHGKLGLRGGDTAEIAMDDVYVGPEAVLGPIGAGMKIALSALDHGRFALAAATIGVAQEALDASLAYAAERQQWGGPIATKQLVQSHLADMHVDISAARGLVDQVVRRMAEGLRFTLEASTAKLFTTEAATRCADRAVQIHGGYGYIDEYPVQRLLRDARVTTLYEGTSEVQRLLIGRTLTGYSAF